MLICKGVKKCIMKSIRPLKNDGNMIIDTGNGDTHSFRFGNVSRTMHSNKIFAMEEIDKYGKFNRYGYIDLYEHDQVLREYLFFTKPDLYIFDSIENEEESKKKNKKKELSYTQSVSYENCTLQPNLKVIPFFRDAEVRYKRALAQLQLSVTDPVDSIENPFMCILSNMVTSKLDLPAVSADTNNSTSNMYGISMSYRSHSIKSDISHDFTLSFTDSHTLELYHMVKAYDLYMRMLKLGEIGYNAHFMNYIISHAIPENFSIYKFLVGSDGETILYYAKATGVYFTNVPREEFGDPNAEGFKYSLGFHAFDVDDNNPLILSEFNSITPAANSDFLDIYDPEGVNNEWARYPRIVVASGDKRVDRRGTVRDYRLKWTNTTNRKRRTPTVSTSSSGRFGAF